MWKEIGYWVITLGMMAVTVFGLELGMALALGPFWGRPLLCDAHLQVIIGSTLMILATIVYFVMNSVRPKHFRPDEEGTS